MLQLESVSFPVLRVVGPGWSLIGGLRGKGYDGHGGSCFWSNGVRSGSSVASLFVRPEWFGCGPSVPRQAGSAEALDEAVVVGVDDGLDPVAQTKLREHPRDVGLHGRLREE